MSGYTAGALGDADVESNQLLQKPFSQHELVTRIEARIAESTRQPISPDGADTVTPERP